MLLLVAVALVLVTVNCATIKNDCPFLPCPFTGFCKATVPTVFTHNGVKCPGCHQCVVEQQEMPSSGSMVMLHVCPMVMCMYLSPCPVPMVYKTYPYQGLNCTGCGTCPVTDAGNLDTVGKRNLKLGDIVDLPWMCPMVMCMDPGHCDVPYITSKFHPRPGVECPGCAVCPTNTVQKTSE